jgi:hypothetical protein
MSLTKSEMKLTIEKHLPDALEHLYDFSHLGTHPLAHLHIVSNLLIHDQTPLTHVDRGRALSKALHIAIDELKPSDEPANVGHEGRFYHILHQAYREGKENHEIALDLAISERTFYRDRKRALCALAQVVWDMESET